MTLNEIFKNTTYDGTLFSEESKAYVESKISQKTVRGSEVPYITCEIRKKEIKLTPSGSAGPPAGWSNTCCPACRPGW